jgi:small-conductance mechanosensitive channel
MFYELSREQREIRQQMKGCHQALVELETRAGIAETAEKLRTEPPNYLGIYDAAERESDEQRELETAEERFHEERTTRRLRDLYFTVTDAEFRKELIAKDREAGRLNLRFWQEELSDATSKLRAARSAYKYWWVWASICGVVLIGFGAFFFGLIGAFGGLLVGYFIGRSMELSALRERERATADAERELKEAEQTWNEVRNQPQTFSRREAKTGEPDPDGRLQAV